VPSSPRNADRVVAAGAEPATTWILTSAAERGGAGIWIGWLLVDGERKCCCSAVAADELLTAFACAAASTKAGAGTRSTNAVNLNLLHVIILFFPLTCSPTPAHDLQKHILGMRLPRAVVMRHRLVTEIVVNLMLFKVDVLIHISVPRLQDRRA
jgi:hypothetical protein